MDGEAANADTAGPDPLQGVVRHTDGAVAWLFVPAQQRGKSLVLTVYEMAVGHRYVRKPGLAADDGDRRVGQACQIPLQVAQVNTADIVFVGEVTHIVQAVL